MNERAIEIVTKNEMGLEFEELKALVRRFGKYLPCPLHERVSLTEYATKVRDHAAILFARNRNREVRGLAIFYVNDHKTHRSFVTLISVDPRDRARGLGRIVMKRVIAVARESHMETMSLKVDSSNYDAIGLYRSLGFRVKEDSGARIVMELHFARLSTTQNEVPTPLQSLPSLRTLFDLDIDLKIKRDGLYPEAGGGNKARKASLIIPHIVQTGHTIVVTAGSLNSNHARATALTAAQYGLDCHLVLVGDPSDHDAGGNYVLSTAAATSFEHCNGVNELADAMDNAVARLKADGHRPLYLWGGGHCVQGTEAMVHAAAEALGQASGWIPDVVVVASGTGTTQAGLILGFADTNARIVGISVARDRDRGSDVVRESIEKYYRENGRDPASHTVEFRDEWTCGGYGQVGARLLDVVRRSLRAGLAIDPIYSGKAFLGLLELVESGEIVSGSKVLFWHTGGLMNLVTALSDEPNRR